MMFRSLSLCRRLPSASSRSSAPASAAAEDTTAADMLVGPKHLIERHRQQQQQQQQQAPARPAESGLQQQGKAARQANKQTTLQGSHVRHATSQRHQQQQQPGSSSNAAESKAGMQRPAGQQQGSHKAQVAKDYIGQLRTELPAASFKYACLPSFCTGLLAWQINMANHACQILCIPAVQGFLYPMLHP